MGFCLRDIREDSFGVHPELKNHALRPGDSVKVGFVPDPVMPRSFGGESMWVVVEKVLKGRYEGFLDNDPIMDELGLVWGDTVEFGPENVISVKRKE